MNHCSNILTKSNFMPYTNFSHTVLIDSRDGNDLIPIAIEVQYSYIVNSTILLR